MLLFFMSLNVFFFVILTILTELYTYFDVENKSSIRLYFCQ